MFFVLLEPGDLASCWGWGLGPGGGAGPSSFILDLANAYLLGVGYSDSH